MLFHKYISPLSTLPKAAAGVSAVRGFATVWTRPLITDLIKHDHRELEAYHDKILNAIDEDGKTRWQNQFVWELSRHSVGEELVLYPSFEKYLGEKGSTMANKDRAMHRELKQTLYRFQKLDPFSSDFYPTLDTLYTIFKTHINEEENFDLPSLESALKSQDTTERKDPGYTSGNLAKRFYNTKKFVPTRSHPGVPDRPPAEALMGVPTALMDRIGDLFRKFPKESAGVGPRPEV
ncbi:hypothetical protein RUND412_008970 [Rhizina undulata]